MAKLKPRFHVITPEKIFDKHDRSMLPSSRSTLITSANTWLPGIRSPSGSSSGPTWWLPPDAHPWL